MYLAFCFLGLVALALYLLYPCPKHHEPEKIEHITAVVREEYLRPAITEVCKR